MCDLSANDGSRRSVHPHTLFLYSTSNKKQHKNTLGDSPLMHRRILLSTSCALLLFVSLSSFLEAAPPNMLTRPERLAGWKLLFDGKTTRGWRRYGGGPAGKGWQVIDGTLVRAANGAGDLITEQRYRFFDLSLEYRIDPGSNSGVMFWVNESATHSWHTGPEIQIIDHPKAGPRSRSGSLYALYPARADVVRPPGEWNELRLHLGPDGGEVQINGIRAYRFQVGSDDWKRRVAKSKFAKFADFAKVREGHICLQDHGGRVAFRNVKIREIGPDGQVPNPVTGTLPLEPVNVFTKVRWSGWSPVDERGLPQPQRPIVLTHAGDGSGRIFVATQRGVIHILKNTQEPQTSRIFLDLQDRVIYKDRENEEGFLGLAFHPRFAENRKFFVYYTTRHAPHTSVISSFRVSKDDPDRALPESEVEILRIRQPFWNHNGGTIAFGPDGYLYVGLGDGGSANDPQGNGQNLSTLLGSILRLDVDRTDDGKAYAIPPDNPFVGVKGARPEIFAYGLRNVWRLAFDRQTGRLWAADVGQNSWEEIDLIEKGGNYGWNFREGLHPFGTGRPPEDARFLDPIWEYDHTVGKSITGGFVYRGRRFPELIGCYVYADYVTGRIWALKYDTATGRVVDNYAIEGPSLPIISFGEDESGEIYFMVVSSRGTGIYTFRRR